MAAYELVPGISTVEFEAELKKLFHVNDLAALDEQHNEIFKVGDDSKTSFHTVFYDKYRSGWPELENMYKQLVEEVCKTYLSSLGNTFLYQKFPTVRFHLNGNLAVGDFHKDAEFNHPEGEINFVIPLTDSDGTASIWVESKEGAADFSPMHMQKGTLISFNGNKLTHGNKINDTGKTRVSMDFRILPINKYTGNYGESLTRKTKFIEGEYYRRITV